LKKGLLKQQFTFDCVVFLRNKGFSIKIYKPEDFHVSYPPKKIRITETALAGERLLGFYKTFPKSEFNAIGKVSLLRLNMFFLTPSFRLVCYLVVRVI